MKSEKISYQNDKMIKLLKVLCLGLLGGAVVSALVLLLCSMMFTAAKVAPGSDSTLETIGLLICIIGAFFSGYITVRIIKEKGLLYGAISGLLLFLVIFTVSSISLQEIANFTALIKCISMILSGSIAGIIGVNKKKRRK